MLCGWQVVLDRFAERREIVELHCREHVVLHMILHVPVEEPDERAASVGAAAEPEIRHIGQPQGRIVGRQRAVKFCL